MTTAYVKCRECGAENESQIQIAPDALRTSTLLGNSQQCQECGATVMIENDTVYFRD